MQKIELDTETNVDDDASEKTEDRGWEQSRQNKPGRKNTNPTKRGYMIRCSLKLYLAADNRPDKLMGKILD